MRLVIRREQEPVPYLGAYVRLAGTEGEPAGVAVVLGAETGVEALGRLLGLVLALKDRAGGAPIRQLWLQADNTLRGRLDGELGARQAQEAERLAGRVEAEWGRFLGNALARLRGEARGDAHFRYPGGAWEAERPTVQVVSWPPLEGESLPVLE